MKHFYKVLSNNLASIVVNNFVWFALIFWVYIETRSVLATSIIGGAYMLFSALCGLYFGTYVDHHKKKNSMVVSSIVSLVLYSLAAVLFYVTPKDMLLDIGNLEFWLLTALVLLGAVAGNLRYIALATTISLLVPEKRRDKANGLVGTINGIGFTLTSVFSGLAVGLLDMSWVFAITVFLTALALIHMTFIDIPEKEIVHTEEASKKVDFKGALSAIRIVPGLLALIFYATFNNFLGGVFMALMDPYGLSLVSVEVYGIIWALVSAGFIFGGMVIATKGLGVNPLKTLFFANIAMWVLSIIFPIKSSIILFAVCMLLYMCLIPVVEAAEQTIIQKVVPLKMQGRVFGFAQSVEMAASPITTFLIGPLTQLVVIPFMTSGSGSKTIGSWFGTGPVRAMALVFMMAGVIGLAVTLLAFSSRSYKVLSKRYQVKQPQPELVGVAAQSNDKGV
jgi:MFS transporter, DHA3 family, multidrug efflux protein